MWSAQSYAKFGDIPELLRALDRDADSKAEQKGIDPNILLYALYGHQYESCETLFMRGADPCGELPGESFLGYIVSCDFPDQFIELFLRHGAKIHDYERSRSKILIIRLRPDTATKEKLLKLFAPPLPSNNGCRVVVPS